MKRKRWMIPVCAAAGLLLLCVGSFLYLAANMLNFSVGRLLIADNGFHIAVVDGYGPICLSAPEGLFDSLETGDKLLILHGPILESYPAQTAARAVFKLGGGGLDDIPEQVLTELGELGWWKAALPDGPLPEEAVESSSFWVNWIGEGNFYLAALNSDKLALSSVQHLPVFRFETSGELEAFKERFAGEFAMDHEIDGFGPSFADVTAGMDEAYFADRTVFVVYVPASSGSYRFGVDSVYREGEALCIHVEETGHPEVATCDMAGWFMTVSLGKSLTAGITDIDADLTMFTG